MQQILNYTPKVERLHHQYQIQGEVNKTLLYEDFYEKSEEEKDRVLEPDKASEKLVEAKKEGKGENYYLPQNKRKKEKENKPSEFESETQIDIKV